MKAGRGRHGLAIQSEGGIRRCRSTWFENDTVPRPKFDRHFESAYEYQPFGYWTEG
jgi:hypothetical protein